MGLSGILLKEKRKFDIGKLVNDIKNASKKSGLLCKEGGEYKKDSDGSYNYLTFNIMDINTDENQFLLYAYNDIGDIIDGRYDFIDKNKNYQQIINIEDFSFCEKMLLDFVYEYLKLNQEDIFYDGLDWHYKYKDIEKIAEGIFDKDWCYKSPSD